MANDRIREGSCMLTLGTGADARTVSFWSKVDTSLTVGTTDVTAAQQEWTSNIANKRSLSLSVEAFVGEHDTATSSNLKHIIDLFNADQNTAPLTLTFIAMTVEASPKVAFSIAGEVLLTDFAPAIEKDGALMFPLTFINKGEMTVSGVALPSA